MTVRASARASELVPPRRFSMARASVFTVITSLHPAPGGNLGPRRFYRFAGLWPQRSFAEPLLSLDWTPRTTFILSRRKIAEHLLSRLARLGHVSGFHATEVRESDCEFGQVAPGRPFQRRVRLRELLRE